MGSCSSRKERARRRDWIAVAAALLIAAGHGGKQRKELVSVVLQFYSRYYASKYFVIGIARPSYNTPLGQPLTLPISLFRNLRY
ncbi:hypothetical protein TgHK011_001885 [Trichoderma gracile]|nr:hypothetical protein TgHK011_001885 [Trichoderma gracile]